ncbi:MAG TPA: TolC family protein [Enhygromyxa sp.]|nr:TolC family protein [Enhygromyxa sp.]
MIRLALLALLSAPPELPTLERPAVERVDTQRDEVLALADVLASMTAHDPRLAVADHAVTDAEGQVMSARGGFDTSVQFTQFFEPLNRTAISRVHVEQATPLFGLSAWAGYQIGVSSNPLVTPVWEPGSAGRLMTATGGELFAGVTLPLVRDSWVDGRRTELAQSKLERERLGEIRDATQLQLELEAATAYWDWVAAGLEVEIERRVLDLAVVRQDRFLRQIELGAVDRLVGVDNQRVILDREGRVVSAERAFQAAALQLSMYLRDGSGQPLVVGVERLPSELPELPSPDAIDLQADIDTALAQRPDRAAQLRSREQSDLELRWARNQRTPRVDLSAWASQELGRNPTLDSGETTPQRTELVTTLHVEIPIPMRWARGRVQSAEASLDIAGQQLRLLDDQIAVEVTDAHSAVVAAHKRALLAGEQVALTEELAQAELRRFELGDGDLLQVNLRELTIADAAGARVRAVADYFIAKANLEVAKGGGVVPVDP